MLTDSTVEVKGDSIVTSLVRCTCMHSFVPRHFIAQVTRGPVGQVLVNEIPKVCYMERQFQTVDMGIEFLGNSCGGGEWNCNDLSGRSRQRKSLAPTLNFRCLQLPSNHA